MQHLQEIVTEKPLSFTEHIRHISDDSRANRVIKWSSLNEKRKSRVIYLSNTLKNEAVDQDNWKSLTILFIKRPNVMWNPED